MMILSRWFAAAAAFLVLAVSFAAAEDCPCCKGPYSPAKTETKSYPTTPTSGCCVDTARKGCCGDGCCSECPLCKAAGCCAQASHAAACSCLGFAGMCPILQPERIAFAFAISQPGCCGHVGERLGRPISLSIGQPCPQTTLGLRYAIMQPPLDMRMMPCTAPLPAPTPTLQSQVINYYGRQVVTAPTAAQPAPGICTSGTCITGRACPTCTTQVVVAPTGNCPLTCTTPKAAAQSSTYSCPLVAAQPAMPAYAYNSVGPMMPPGPLGYGPPAPPVAWTQGPVNIYSPGMPGMPQLAPPSVPCPAPCCVPPPAAPSSNVCCIVAEKGQVKVTIQGDDLTTMTCKEMSLKTGSEKALKFAVADGQVQVVGNSFEATADQVQRMDKDDTIVLQGHVHLAYTRSNRHGELEADAIALNVTTGNFEVKLDGLNPTKDAEEQGDDEDEVGCDEWFTRWLFGPAGCVANAVFGDSPAPLFKAPLHCLGY